MNRIGLAALLLVSLLLGTAASCDRHQPEPEAPLVGFADFHNHEFAYLGFGGKMISHSVDPDAGCIATPEAHQDLVARQLISSGLFGEANKQPSGQCFPTITNLASQRVDTANLKRAWEYGLRLMVMMAVNSEFLCKLVGLPSCQTDRVSIERQIQAAKDLQSKIDEEAGGPGKGWYQIVTTPAQARDVIKQGKLAVVLGIEAANAFGCRTEKVGAVIGIEPIPPGAAPTEDKYDLVCNNVRDIPFPSLVNEPPLMQDETVGVLGEQKALALFEHYWQLGVRHFFLTHNLNGIAGGTALSEMILHAKNNPAEIENGQIPLLFDRKDEINRVITSIRPSFVSAPCPSLYEFDGGVCNQQGLSATGRQLATLMAAHGALIDTDHLSWRARRQLMNDDGLLKGIYPMISSHSGVAALNHGNAKNEGELSPDDVNQIIRLKGAFAPRLPTAGQVQDQDTYPSDAPQNLRYRCGGTSEAWVQAYRYLVDQIRQGRPGATVGIGIGTDFGPPIPFFAAPRFYKPGQITGEVDPALLVVGQKTGANGKCWKAGDADAGPMVQYPLTHSAVVPGTPFAKSTTPWDGRTPPHEYDISYDGVVHVGMLPDFIEELMAMGMTSDDLQPLWHGAEAYIRTWEIADGFKSQFDVEGERRGTCELQRQHFLEAMDEPNYALARESLEALKTNACRGRHGLP